ncbi:hypothetical protein BJX64DRAFT_294256 [Aspergillus heterothallicus]
MPSDSAIFGHTITNWGPLPTDWALPAECMSSTSWALAYDGQADAPVWHDCSINADLVCLPTPTDSGAVETVYEVNQIPGDGVIAAYYSPGAACPSGWKTVGAAAREESTVSRSGMIMSAHQEDIEGRHAVRIYDLNQALVDLLAVGETAVWCCPSSMIGGLQDQQCYSTLSNYQPSTACNTFYTASDIGTYTTGLPGDDGRTTDGELVLVTATTSGTVESTVFSQSEATDFIAYSQLPPVRFVHGGSDSGEDSDDEQDSSEPSEDPSETNGAGRIAVTGTGPWGGIVGSLLASVVAGAAIVLVR